MGVTIKVETNGSDGAKNLLTKDEIANCDGIIVAAEKKIETARFDGKPVLFTRVDDGIHTVSYTHLCRKRAPGTYW